MPVDLTALFAPNAQEDAVRGTTQMATNNAVRAATAGAQSRGAVNPAAQALLQSQTIANAASANAQRLASAQAADRLAQAGAIQGMIGMGANVLGSVGGMALPGSQAITQPVMGAATQALQGAAGPAPTAVQVPYQFGSNPGMGQALGNPAGGAPPPAPVQPAPVAAPTPQPVPAPQVDPAQAAMEQAIRNAQAQQTPQVAPIQPAQVAPAAPAPAMPPPAPVVNPQDIHNAAARTALDASTAQIAQGVRVPDLSQPIPPAPAPPRPARPQPPQEPLAGFQALANMTDDEILSRFPFGFF